MTEKTINALSDRLDVLKRASTIMIDALAQISRPERSDSLEDHGRVSTIVAQEAIKQVGRLVGAEDAPKEVTRVPARIRIIKGENWRWYAKHIGNEFPVLHDPAFASHTHYYVEKHSSVSKDDAAVIEWKDE